MLNIPMSLGSGGTSLLKAQQDDTADIVGLLEARGPSLPFPYSSGIEGSRHDHMRELRIQSGGNPLRVFYAFDSRRSAILLIGGDKTGNDRFYEILPRLPTSFTISIWPN